MKLTSMVTVAVVQGMETPSNKKGKSNVTPIKTKLQHPPPPLPEHLTVVCAQGAGNLNRNFQSLQRNTSVLSFNMEMF